MERFSDPVSAEDVIAPFVAVSHIADNIGDPRVARLVGKSDIALYHLAPSRDGEAVCVIATHSNEEFAAASCVEADDFSAQGLTLDHAAKAGGELAVVAPDDLDAEATSAVEPLASLSPDDGVNVYAIDAAQVDEAITFARDGDWSDTFEVDVSQFNESSEDW